MTERAGPTGRAIGGSDASGGRPGSLAGWAGVDLDLRALTFVEARAPVLRAASHAGEREYVRVRMNAISWPLMAALQASGQTYRIAIRSTDTVEFLVWRRYSGKVRRRYLLDRVGRPIYEPPLRPSSTERA